MSDVTQPALGSGPAPSGRPSSKKKRLNPLTIVLGLSAAFFAFFLVVSGVLFLYKSPSTSSSRPAAFFGGSGFVGVVELNGVIMDSKKVLRRLESFEEDDMVKAVVLRMNSPGGAVAPSQEIYEAVKAFKKPLVVSMGSVAASGAYYISCGAKKVYANPGTITGSIGVIMEFLNLEKLYQWAKIHRYALKTGKYKGSGAEYREMSPEEKALLQGMIDDVLVQFKKAVAMGRKLPMTEVTKVADGRIFSGSQAKAAKLVDELGTLQDAINEAGKLGKISGKPKVIYPDRKKRKWMDLILDEGTPDDSEAGAEARGSLNLIHIIRQLLHAAPAESQAEMAPGIYWLWSGPN